MFLINIFHLFHKTNRVWVLFLISAFIYSCSSLGIEQPMILTEETSEVGDAIFCQSASGQLYKYQKDPFSLSNMQAAYDNVADDFLKTKSSSTFIKKGGRLSPTHLALRMYPKTMKEWNAIENLEDISLSYHPFDYAPVPGDGTGNNVLEAPFEKSRYFETYTCFSTASDQEREETIALPILYVVWPIHKELPTEWEYTVDYEVCIPHTIVATKGNPGISTKDRKALEREAIYLALGKRIVSINQELQTKRIEDEDDSANFKVLTGSVSCFDDSSWGLMPMERLGMRFELGTVIHSGASNGEGTYDITLDTEYHDYLNFSFYFQAYDFDIRLAPSTAVYKYCVGTVAEVFGTGLYEHKDFNLSNLPETVLNAHQAATYYYNASHGLTQFNSGTRITINAYSNAPLGEGITGEFVYSADGTRYINIYKASLGTSASRIATTLHELGHYLHYGKVGGFTNYVNTNKAIKESFASFVGWKLGHLFYEDHLYYDLYSGMWDETEQGRQDWTSNDSWPEYTPIFIDLQDSYNQSYYPYANNLVNDNISGVPTAIIETLITNNATWSSLCLALNNYVGTYYSQLDLNTMLSFY